MVATASTEHSYWLALALPTQALAFLAFLFRLRNARNASDCILMETGLNTLQYSLHTYRCI